MVDEREKMLMMMKKKMMMDMMMKKKMMMMTMMVVVCTDGVKSCWQFFFGKPFAGPFGKYRCPVLLVSWRSLNCVSVVCGVLVALWVVCP